MPTRRPYSWKKNVYTRDHAEFLTADGQASFARGTEASVEQSQEEACSDGYERHSQQSFRP